MNIAPRKSNIIHWGVSETPEAQPIQTLSTFHYLIYNLYPTNPHLFEELISMECLSYLFLPSFLQSAFFQI